ncbi:hypothetical protein [Arenibacter latericius]|uniref:hypothetical protein n=1 Tax=Arenibacter latericius TaxID=86104 RepID=UPI000424F3EF|nr:hypothetical protein [Arenibacter latericius]MDX1362785.1 hypothetical protein [Arenibacter latericius]
MKNTLTYILLVLMLFGTKTLVAQENFSQKLNADEITTQKGEVKFLAQVDRSLLMMEKAAKELQVKGVAVMAFVPGEEIKSIVSKMKVVGALANDRINYLAVANSKIAEMTTTLTHSGSTIRKPLIGETGWRGGLIKKVASGYILVSFSGGSEDQDVIISNAGLTGMEDTF